MEEKIIDYLNQYLEKNPDKISPDRFRQRIKDNIKSFEHLTERGYIMNMEITEEGSFEIKFMNEEGFVYTSYGFNKAVISKDSLNAPKWRRP